MTKIRHKDKPTWHETAVVDPHSKRKLCIAETPVNLLIKLKGTRQQLCVPLLTIYAVGARAAGDALIETKRRRRSVRRGALAIGG